MEEKTENGPRGHRAFRDEADGHLAVKRDAAKNESEALTRPRPQH